MESSWSAITWTRLIMLQTGHLATNTEKGPFKIHQPNVWFLHKSPHEKNAFSWHNSSILRPTVSLKLFQLFFSSVFLQCCSVRNFFSRCESSWQSSARQAEWTNLGSFSTVSLVNSVVRERPHTKINLSSEIEALLIVQINAFRHKSTPKCVIKIKWGQFSWHWYVIWPFQLCLCA